MDIADLLIQTKERGCSDLHLSAGVRPMVRLHGELTPLDDQVLGKDEVHRMIYEILNDEQRRVFEETRDLDFALEVGEIARFRVNVFNQRRGQGAVFRVIPTQIRSFEELGLPEVLRTLAMRENGLVLVTGPTGSGKSTTLATLIDHVNQKRRSTSSPSRTPSSSSTTPSSAWSTSGRSAPTPSRSPAPSGPPSARTPTSSWSARCATWRPSASPSTAAETGHLVFGTLHTKSAPKTVDRVIDAFPPAQQQQVRAQLSEALQGVVPRSCSPPRTRRAGWRPWRSWSGRWPSGT